MQLPFVRGWLAKPQEQAMQIAYVNRCNVGEVPSRINTIVKPDSANEVFWSHFGGESPVFVPSDVVATSETVYRMAFRP